ncbi:hypothetical protein BKA62DRAFT_825381 [Auriculariales sp. MPI-PUGE-AT-0066]|nr:hypothetical protein BKA62DRAFT_825381 [Auriculariales sp. MPI-PUGE-AT-0066]
MHTSLPAFVSAPVQAAQGYHGVFRHLPGEDTLAEGSTPIRWLPASTGNKLIIFLPGNPGILAFYDDFLRQLHDNLNREVSILGHSHLGHTPGVPQPSNSSLNTQIDAVVRVIDAAVAGGFTDITLLGHSVGSWISVQAFKQRTEVISKVLMVTPTISELRKSPNGQRVGWLTNPPMPLVISHLTFLARLLPEVAVAALFPDWPRTQECAFSALSMAHNEMVQMRSIDTDILSAHTEKFWAIFANGDAWLGEEQEARVVRTLGESDRLVHLDVPHAFSINHSELMAKECSKALRM